MKLDIFGSKSISPIENPFNFDSIESIRIVMSRSIFSRKIMYYAIIEFQKNNTKGEQRIDATSLTDAFIKCKEFVENL